VSDAPEDFTEKLIAAVVGIEMTITRLSGKWKVSQNQSPQNQHSVMQALNASGKNEAITMAALIAQSTHR
jgi:transcriptional regulator